jgi:hypothetical protein
LREGGDAIACAWPSPSGIAALPRLEWLARPAPSLLFSCFFSHGRSALPDLRLHYSRIFGAAHGAVPLVAISRVNAFARKYAIAVSALVIRYIGFANTASAMRCTSSSSQAGSIAT